MKINPRKYAGRIAAGGIMSCLLGIAYAPFLEVPNTDGMSERFRFDARPIEPADVSRFRSIRAVHPDFEHMAGWISAVGASVAFGDLDNDRKPNDICLVDPRNDTVTLRPVDADGEPRYAPMLLEGSPVANGPDIAPMGCFFADMNVDGLEDVVVYYWGRGPIVFENTGALQSDGFAAFDVAPGEVWYSNAAVFTDLDGDGYGDLMFGNYFPDGAGVLDRAGTRPVEMQHSMSRAFNAGQNRLFLNAPAGAAAGGIALEDHSDALSAEMKNGWTLALGAADLNADGLPEVYVGNDFGPDRMLLNRSTLGQPEFELVTTRRGLTDTRSSVMGKDSFKGMGVEFADLDGNGGFDIFVSNIAAEYALHESHMMFMHTGADSWVQGRAPYKNRSGPLGLARSDWAWDAKMMDFDNDGVLEALQTTGFMRGTKDRWPELHELAMGNDELLRLPGVWPAFGQGDDLSGQAHDVLFVQDGDGRFNDMSKAAGLGKPAVSRGIALADYDLDGDLDFAIARQWEGSELYENLSPEFEPPPLKWSAPIVRKAEDQRWPLRDPSPKRLS